jgi:hypothetical protein
MKLFNCFWVLGMMMYSMQAQAVSERQAIDVGLKYALSHDATLKAHPFEIKPFAYWTSDPNDAFKIQVENDYSNNSYHCEFQVMVDAISGDILPTHHIGNTSREWSCEFLGDYGGGM